MSDFDANDIAAALENVLPVTEYPNAPKSLEEAIMRIQALEQALDNVCYGLEISEFTGKYDHVKPYVQEAFVLLETRIPHPDQDVKAEKPVTIYEGKGVISEEQIKRLAEND